MDDFNKELERLKKLAGSWEKLAKILYMAVPAVERKQIPETIEFAKIFKVERRGRKEKYSFEQLFEWNRLVEQYCADNDCKRPEACRKLVESKRITLPQYHNRAVFTVAKRLDKILEEFRTEQNKRVARMKGTTSSILDTLLQDTPDYPED